MSMFADTQTLFNRSGPIPAVDPINAPSVPLPISLDDYTRWDDTDPDDWPEWADVPVPIVLTGQTKDAQGEGTPRGLNRRGFLKLAGVTVAVGMGGGLVGGSLARAASSPGPLERAYRRVAEAQAVLIRMEDKGATDQALRTASDRSDQAMRSLVRTIAAACPVPPQPLGGSFVENRSTVVAGSVMEGGRLYQLVYIDDGSTGYVGGLGSLNGYRAIVCDLDRGPIVPPLPMIPERPEIPPCSPPPSYRAEPGPLALAHRKIISARLDRVPIESDPGRDAPFGSPESEDQERRLGEAIRRECEAERLLVDLIARKAGVDLDNFSTLMLANIAANRPVVVAVEAGQSYQVVALPGPSGDPIFRPLVLDGRDRA